MDIQNNLAEIRRQSGLSVQELSDLTGISAPTLYGVEAGRFIPNTAAALKLAWVLCVQVEDIFQLTVLPPARLAAASPAMAESSGSWCCP